MRGFGLNLLPLLGAGAALATSESGASWTKRQMPNDPTGVKKITTPNGVTIRYKEPGKEGVCETTPGVNSYSGYVDLSPESHSFFEFFEARHDPAHAPITLWLNGGPGSDSLIGLYQGLFPVLWVEGFVLMDAEHGPCQINSNFESYVNPYSWNEVSNMLYLSQPLGVGMLNLQRFHDLSLTTSTGFSYAEEGPGSLNPVTGEVEPASFAGVQGRYGFINETKIGATPTS